ncbi:MAG: hypothetical protein KDD27_09100 [Saprospiraceae bacterium]|nr:hypothetical protein [Saprospiraceae bacterium]
MNEYHFHGKSIDCQFVNRLWKMWKIFQKKMVSPNWWGQKKIKTKRIGSKKTCNQALTDFVADLLDSLRKGIPFHFFGLFFHSLQVEDCPVPAFCWLGLGSNS